MFISIDAWHVAAFDRLAAAMTAALPGPLHTVVDETDIDLTARWQRAGFTMRRREWEYAVPTEPFTSALPPDVTLRPFGAAEEAPLRELDHVVRAEVEAGPGWRDMPVEVLGHAAFDPAKYAVAAQGDRYVGLLRIATVTRMPRIGLIAVRSGQQRRGIARALLAHALSALHHIGKRTASAEVTESNVAAAALFEGIGAQRTGSNLELVLG